MHHFTMRHAAALIAAIAASAGAAAQSQGPVLKPSQVTENVLVDALGGKGEDGAATRSIRPSMKAQTPSAQTAAAPGKANLLITFATGSAELTPETKNTLEVVAKALRSDRLAGLSFRVEGHADPRGTPEYNVELSGKRAEAVVAYLTGPLGVAPDRLKPVGKGASELMDPARPEAAENRRVTIVTDR